MRDIALRIDLTRLVAPLAAAAMLGLALPAAAGPASRLAYSVSLAGFPIARADLSLADAGGRYSLAVDWRTAGLASVFAAQRGEAAAGGRLGAARPLPASYRLAGGDPAKRIDVAIALTDGTVRSAAVSPPPATGDDRVPMRPNHRRDVLDPLSAAIAPGSTTPETLCRRTLPIFDGWSRWDVRLSPKSTRAATLPGFDGPLVVCAARWVPVAGHRPNHNATRYMADNTDLEVTFGRLVGGRVWLPVEAAVGTRLGTARLALDEAVAAAPAPPAKPRRKG